MRQLLFFTFNLLCLNLTAQVIVTREDIMIDTHHMDEVGKELVIRKDKETPLPPNNYICNYTKGDRTIPIKFTINEMGKPEGVVSGENYFKTFVKNGMIYKFESYSQMSGKVIEEGFMRGDTSIIKNYNKHNQLRSEYRKINGETVYDFNCSYYGDTDSLSTCSLRDDVKGLYVDYYEGGKIRSKAKTKNLAKGISKQSEEFDEKGKVTEKKIEYSNGKSKIRQADGSYTIESEGNGGRNVEQYTKAGKLIKKFTAYYPSAPAMAPSAP